MKTVTYAVRALFMLAVLAAGGAVSAQDPIFSSEVSAADRREHIVNFARWGRYRFEASGADGVTLQVADKLRGAFASNGPTSGGPARIETFLEAGEYKVITYGEEDASGSVKVSAWEYVVDSANDYMTVHMEITAALTNAGAVARWIFVPRDTTVYIEAMGRHLGGLAVFRGDLLVAEAPARGESAASSFVNDANRQKPLNGLRIVQRLERGKHLVVAYGGGRDRYAQSDDNAPLFMQWMPQPLNPTRQINAKIRESGVNRYSVSPNALYWLIEGDTTLTVEIHDVGQSGARQSARFNLTRGSGGYRYTASQGFSATASQNETRMISVIGKPGAEFRLSPISQTSQGGIVQNFTPPAEGAYQFRTVHSGRHENDIGASGFLIDMYDSSIIAFQGDTLSESSPQLRREFNMLSGSGQTAFIMVDKPGMYRFEPGGVDYLYRITPFYVMPPRDLAALRPNSRAADFNLRAGLHVIEITPRSAAGLGRASFTISGGRQRGAVAPAKPAASVRLTNLVLRRGRTYRFVLNSQAPEAAAVFMERVPAEAEANRPVYHIGRDAEREELTTAKMPELEFGKIQYSAYEKSSLKTHRFEIREAGIYKIETTGRLSTKLTVRNRVGAVIATAAGNGAGRNSVIAEYLLPGQYALVAETQGESAGLMGIVINKGDLTHGGQLAELADMRTTVREFGAVVYNINVNESGRYRFDTYGQSGMMTARLEDSGGWPVFEHGSLMPMEADVTRGAYRIFTLPLTHASERVTGMRRIGRTTAGVCADSLAGVNDFLRAGGCYNFISVAAPPQAREEEDEEEYYYRDSRPAEPAYSMSDRTVRVRVDTAGVYEIYSQGGTNVSATLFAENKTAVAARDAGDERNWNFVISEQLVPGTYYLNMAPDAVRFPSTQVFMRRVEDTLAQPARPTTAEPVVRTLSPNGKQIVIPITVSSGDVLTLKAASGSRIACVLESRSGGGAAAIGRSEGREIRISVPVAREAEYALKIRSLDGWSVGKVDVVIGAVESTPVKFQEALTGVSGTVERNRHFGNEAFFRIDDVLGGPGHYELSAAENEVVSAAWTNAAHRIFRQEEGSLLAASGGLLLFKAAFSAAGQYNITLNPVRLAGSPQEELSKQEDGRAPRRRSQTSERGRASRSSARAGQSAATAARGSIPVMMRGGENKIFEIDAPARSFGLLTFLMNTGQPVAGLSATSNRAVFRRGAIFVHGGQHISDKVCVTAVVPGDTGRIIAWNALTVSGRADGIHGTLTMTNFAVDANADTLKTGRTVWSSQTPSAREYRLESGRNRVVTARLSPQSGVFYISPDGRRDMYYGGDGGAVHSIDMNGGRLFLFGGLADEDAAAGNIELETFASAPSASNELSAAAAFTKHFSIDTRQRIRVDGRAYDRNRIFWSGAIRGVDWINRHGQMRQNIPSGSTFNSKSGVALVDFEAGWSALRLCPVSNDPLEVARCIWGERLSGYENAPVITEMSRMPMADGVNWYNINLSGPAHVSLFAPVPSVAVTLAGGGLRDCEEFWDELSIDVPLPQGGSAVGIRPIAGRSLDGVPLTVRFYPILTLTEDEPLSVYLSPGEKRMARFDLGGRSRIGIGLQVAAETVEAILLDSAGGRIGRGRQIFAELDKGAYYVLLSTPRTSDGVNVTARLFGQNAPPADPPAERIRWIVEGGVGERP